MSSIFVVCSASGTPAKAFYNHEDARTWEQATPDTNGIYEVPLESLLLENATTTLLPLKKPLFHLEFSIG